MEVPIKYSMIIPVYNILKKYYTACLESCYVQANDNIEFIIVDDCSTEEYIKTVSEDYCRKDSRFRYYRLEKNQGVSAARNMGLRVAQGEWILFLDADDYIASDYINNIEKYNIDNQELIIMGYCEVFSSVKQYVVDEEIQLNESDMESFQLAVLTGQGKSSKIPFEKINVCSLVGRIFNRSLFENLQLPIGIKKEQDSITSFKIYQKLKKGKVIPYVGYYYRIHQNSICRKYNPNIENILYGTLKELKKVAYEKNVASELQTAYYIKCLSVVGDMCLLKYIHEDNPNSYFKRRKDFLAILKNKEIEEAMNNVCFSNTNNNINYRNLKIKLFLLKHKMVGVYFLAFRISMKVHNNLHFGEKAL